MRHLDSNRADRFHRNYPVSWRDEIDMACMGIAGRRLRINEQPGLELTHWLLFQSAVRQSQKTSGIIQDCVG